MSIGCNGETEYLGLKSIEDYENSYKDLSSEISSLCKNMSMSKQLRLQKIIAKAMSLASFRPDSVIPVPPKEKEAGSNGKTEEKSLCNLLKLKSV